MTEATAPKIHYSPLAEARWCYLIEPRAQMDESKPPAWSVELILPAKDPKTQALHQQVEKMMDEAHGTKKLRSDKGMPLKLDKKDPTIMVMKFKAQQLVRNNGTTIPGPKVIDSKKQPWDGSAIGNGSKLIVAYKPHFWDRADGVGMTFIPTAVQVVSFVPYVTDDGVDGFEEQANGYVVPAYAEEFEDEF
jgi:hypothetical protein